MSSTILTVITKEPKVRVAFSQPLRRISGMQLIDYNFPEEHVKFKTPQTMSRSGTVLVTFPPGNYSFVDLITTLNHGIPGISIHGFMSEIHFQNSSGSLSFTDELEKVLNIVNRKPVGVFYSLSWTRLNYQLYVNNINLGLLASHRGTTGGGGGHVDNFIAKPTSLLASIPSSTGLFPLMHLSTGGGGGGNDVVNYLDLELVANEGAEVNFGGKPFGISLRILFND